ncbi:preprotein translocase subunit SecA [Crossiella equi]|uniref:Protein translocase subunit SecA n=1 Tax=Crossiella equi TaxID=130796 RepID=A0ABS5A7C5_9PSEU|nr:accessory Sec system translocase SecA2 [Crossiella equi]MBP2472167.1 preprotein translocase subunit SecA [Crossiella equi]
MRLFWKLLRGKNERARGRSAKLVTASGSHAEWAAAFTDEELAAKAAEHVEDLVRYLAVAREAAERSLGERPFDEQLLGAARLLAGDVVEMATGEGKTLAGAIAGAAFALRGRSVHVVSVNDYLAHRDADWMRPFYDLLGVTVGCLGSNSSRAERRAAYAAQVTYAPVSEIGFDLLRDRLATSVEDLLAPDSDVAIVDEADSVLVDEARVPLVLAGSATAVAPSRAITELVRTLRPGTDFTVDQEGRNVALTDVGAAVVEANLEIDLYSEEHISSTLTLVNLALHARVLLVRDVHYLVKDGRVQLINESRGRVANLQRWPDGLQAAVEAKEGLVPSESGEVLDSMTVQALIRRYKTVCGMTGTAVVAAEQLQTFYNLEVAPIPPHRPCVRVDEPDHVHDTVEEKEDAIIDHVLEVHKTGQPVLLGTLDVAESERIADRLREKGVECTVLNAKNDAKEAAIIAEAGTYGAITVSTQMAGRGTDIRLGGADQHDAERVRETGGLYVIGTGRQLSRRLDDQLRGRAGRQGDPGKSVFFVSLTDELVLRYGPVRNPKMIDHLQRVADAEMLTTHSNTWRYNQLLEHQRDQLAKERDQVLRTDIALKDLEQPCADRLKELRAEGIPEEVLVEAARQVTLHHMDRCWADHLAMLAEVRETIHLRALARENPLDEFHRVVIPAFRQELPAELRRRTVETFNEVPITAEDGADLPSVGLVRPNSTWTYMVQDNPSGSELDRAVDGVAKLVRKRTGGAQTSR